MIRRGMTLIETVVALAIVSALLAAALNAAGAAATTRAAANDRALAQELCQSLLSEITRFTYLDPDTGLNGEGPAAEEASTAHRLNFDDIDDFNGWKHAPPVDREGKEIDSAAGLSREVSVLKYATGTGGSLLSYAGEVKVITVSVYRNRKLLHSVTAVRHPDWDFRESEK